RRSPASSSRSCSSGTGPRWPGRPVRPWAVHRSKAVRAWLAENTQRTELHLMPGYSPELNPDELLNADIKRNIHAARTRSADDLARETRRFLHRRQNQPHIVRGYFHARRLRYTIE
ncbi:transposase, partial [Streptomyces spectabilis]|uniref:transposase n=1 Tax=Streptomyces spectabilis TaxID=68270 RepID=UPI003F4CE1B9